MNGRPRLEGTDWAILLAVGVLVAISLSGDLQQWGGRDWDQLHADLYAARRSLLVEGELPLWMPYRVGGHDAFADPSALWASPLGFLSVALGVPLGTRVFLVLSAMLGALGMLRLGQQLGIGRRGRGLSAALLALSTPLALYSAGGIPTFTAGLALLPWLVLAVCDGSRRSALWGGALLALDLYAGDVNHLIFHSLFLGLLALALALHERRGQVLLHLALLFTTALVLAAPRVVTVGLLARQMPRVTADADRGALTVRLLQHALLNREAARCVERPYGEFVVLDLQGNLGKAARLEEVRPGTGVDWVNVGSYLGWLALSLAAFGLLVILREAPPRARRRLLSLVGAAALMLWLGFGSNGVPNLWGLLKQLPVFSSLRSPARLIVYPFFALCLLAGVGLEGLARALARQGRVVGARVVAVTLLALAILDVYPPARDAYRQSFVEPPIALPSPGRFESYEANRPPGSTYYGVPVTPFVQAGLGVVNGYGDLPIESAALSARHPRYRGEAFALNEASQVSWPEFGSRRIELEVDLPAPDRVVINQNFGRGWRALSPAGARCVRHEDGRLAVTLPGGAATVRLRYTTPGLGLGLAVALLGFPLLVRGSRRLGLR